MALCTPATPPALAWTSTKPSPQSIRTSARICRSIASWMGPCIVGDEREKASRVAIRRHTMAFLKPTLVSASIAAFLLLAMLLLGIFLPQETSRVVLNQYRAVRSIRDLNLAEHSYSAQHPDAGFACELGELGEQGVGPPVGLIDRVLASGTKSWYHFEIRCSQSGSAKPTAYTITAGPTKPRTTVVA